MDVRPQRLGRSVERGPHTGRVADSTGSGSGSATTGGSSGPCAQERFNRTAELAGWPVRLTWFGLEPVAPLQSNALPPCPPEAEAAFRGLIRRFAQPWRLDLASGTPVSSSCDQSDRRQ